MTENDSPSVREIFKQCQIMIGNGHPNVPDLLRRIAKQIERGALDSPKPEKPGCPVISMETRERLN